MTHDNKNIMMIIKSCRRFLVTVFLFLRLFVSLRNDFIAEASSRWTVEILLLLLSFAKPDCQTERISFGFYFVYVTLISLVACYIFHM